MLHVYTVVLNVVLSTVLSVVISVVYPHTTNTSPPSIICPSNLPSPTTLMLNVLEC